MFFNYEIHEFHMVKALHNKYVASSFLLFVYGKKWTNNTDSKCPPPLPGAWIKLDWEFIDNTQTEKKILVQ